jgi:hypothetical protein
MITNEKILRNLGSFTVGCLMAFGSETTKYSPFLGVQEENNELPCTSLSAQAPSSLRDHHQPPLRYIRQPVVPNFNEVFVSQDNIDKG